MQDYVVVLCVTILLQNIADENSKYVPRSRPEEGIENELDKSKDEYISASQIVYGTPEDALDITKAASKSRMILGYNVLLTIQ